MIGEAVERIAANYSASADGYAEFWSPVIRPVGRRLGRIGSQEKEDRD